MNGFWNCPQSKYETEQKELTEKVKTEQQEVDTYEQNKWTLTVSLLLSANMWE